MNVHISALSGDTVFSKGKSQCILLNSLGALDSAGKPGFHFQLPGHSLATFNNKLTFFLSFILVSAKWDWCVWKGWWWWWGNVVKRGIVTADLHIAKMN